MAKKNLFFGGLAMALAFVFGLVLAGCAAYGGDESYDGLKTIKITGYNLEGINPMVMYLKPESAGLFGQPPIAAADPEIDGTTIFYKLAEYGPEWERVKPIEQRNGKPWTGTGEFFIGFWLSPSPNDPSKNASFYFYSTEDTLEDGTNPATPVDINDAVTMLEWSKFYCALDDNI
jgi:hypothetical protein